MNVLWKFFGALFLTVLLFSCSNIKEVTYFNELTDQEVLYKSQSLEPIIQKNDILSITVSSLDPAANELYNLHVLRNSTGEVNAGTIAQTPGYLVDQNGNIEFPSLGTIYVVGMTKQQLKEKITKGLVEKELLAEPVVNIRYMNYRVTVLGEVSRPSVYNIPDEKVTLLEAIGLAGDLTIVGRRDNILIIREVAEGKRILKHVNLNSSDILTSPYYYLQSNDVVYVAPSKKASVASENTTKLWIPTLFGALSFITVVVSLFLRY